MTLVMLHSVIARALVAASLLPAAAWAQALSPDPLVITSPADGSYVTGAVLLLSNDAPAETKAATNGAPHKPKKSAMPRGFVTPFASPTGGGAAAFMTF